MLQTPPPPIEPTREQLEHIQREAYRFCADAIREKLDRAIGTGMAVDQRLVIRLSMLVHKIEKAMRTASEVAPLVDTQTAPAPKSTGAQLPLEKVNGS